VRIEDADSRYLLARIRACEAVLILGAGASYGGTNRAGSAIKLGAQIAQVFAAKAGYTYSGESLPDVYEAVRSKFGDITIHDILRLEYTGTNASDALKSLLSVSWKRSYNFNIDDSIESISFGQKSQRRRSYNGMVDRVADFDTPEYLDVVYLHGQAVIQL
jgi:hypothetical protein